MMSINSFVGLINDELLKEVSIRSEDEFEPVVVKDIPRLWKCLGTGNYAAVFMHRVQRLGSESLRARRRRN